MATGAGLLEVNQFTFWLFHTGYFMEVILLSLAIAQRANIADKEKIDAQNIALTNERLARENQLRAIQLYEEQAQTKQQQIDACIAAGMDGYLSKPIDQVKLRITLSAINHQNN